MYLKAKAVIFTVSIKVKKQKQNARQVFGAFDIDFDLLILKH